MPNQSFGASWILGFGFIAVFICAPVFSWWMHLQGEPVWIQAILWFPVLAVLKAWPRAIRFDDEGITQRTLFGRMKRIRYHEVDDIACTYEDIEPTFQINGAGEEIRHGWLHRDGEEFANLLRQRTGKEIYGWCSQDEIDEVLREIKQDKDADQA